MAESGGAILEWLAAHGDCPEPVGSVDENLVQAAELWLAAAAAGDADEQALSQPDAARRVAALSQTLRETLGPGDDSVERLGQRVPKTTALFSGPSGSGRTLAAVWLATALGREVVRIDLSQVVGKYIGETEKNLDAVFRRAEQSDALLLFDEADALFGKRTNVKDSHDRRADQEVSLLLGRIERYQGVAILATNARQEIDPGLLERLRAVVVVLPIPPRP